MGKRNRIVIDLNQPPPPGGYPKRGSRRAGRAGRILLLIGIAVGIVVLGVCAGGYFWWQHYKSGPAYTLALLVDAAQRNDNEQVDRTLDTDKIAESFVADVRSRVTGSSILNSLVPSQLDQIATSLTPKLKETLREVLPVEIQRVTEPAKGKPFILLAIGMPYFANIRQDGATAAVNMKFKDEQIQLTMQQSESAWRITAIKDDRLTTIIVDAAKKGVSQRGTQFQDEIIKRLKDLQTQTPSPSP